MSAEEFRYWKAYVRKNGPFHWRRTDLNFAKIASLLCCLNMSEDDKTRTPKLMDPESHLLKITTPKMERRKLRRKYSEKNILQNNQRMIATLQGHYNSVMKDKNNGIDREPCCEDHE